MYGHFGRFKGPEVSIVEREQAGTGADIVTAWLMSFAKRRAITRAATPCVEGWGRL